MKILENVLYAFICIYIFILPWKQGKTTYGDGILALIMFLYIIRLVLSSQSRRKMISDIKSFFHDYLSISMSILFLVMIISVSYSFDKKIAVSESARFLSYIILFFIIKYECNYKRYIHGIINSYVFSVCFICIFGIYQYFTGFGLSPEFMKYDYTDKKIAATLDNPTNLAAFLVLALFPIIMVSIYEKNKVKKSVYLLILVLVIINIVLTDSRNALIGVAIGAIILAIVFSWKLIFIIGPAAVISLFIPRISHRILDIANSSQNVSRIYLWKTALKMIKEHPILGVGNGNYVSLYDTYVKKYPELKYPWFTQRPTHNSYLKVTSELGILGIISFVCMLIFSLLKVKQVASSAKDKFYRYFCTGVFASMVGFYFMNISDNLFFVPKTTAYFWILLAISQAIVIRESSSESLF
ncbi:O-antigen ligase family protein [Clostridium sp. P21]|uniref:O-antigen ligase family protein n=1 Tax=Clostridium muellerianum TaxID=2716538 RepID=A0A7Y0ECU5_9CLOT|nr:O-antigen ligase family protein [Clostridium muellerianum]NMM61134.1 O-antigen ligase family protein [Clostridium muellerianum]